MCFTCFLCQFVFNKSFLKNYCLSVHSFFLVSFTSMYTTLKIISRKFLGVSFIWTFFSHVGAIFFETAHIHFENNNNNNLFKFFFISELIIPIKIPFFIFFSGQMIPEISKYTSNLYIVYYIIMFYFIFFIFLNCIINFFLVIKLGVHVFIITYCQLFKKCIVFDNG